VLVDIIAAAFVKSVDEQCMFLLDSRLHDFGMRGCTCVEQTIIGGTAHLINFEVSHQQRISLGVC